MSSVDCPPGTLVVGDLHMDLFEGEAAQRFARWCAALEGVPRLVVLGDLFEFWVGRKQQTLSGTREVLAALRRLVERGTALDVLPGNRDFLLDRHFERASGARIHPAGLIGEHADGERTLFLHGDELCTADRAYQRFRRLVRSRSVRALTGALPFWFQRGLARGLRRASRGSRPLKDAPHRAMQAEAALQCARGRDAQHLICGHGHRFQEQPLPGRGRWIVIDAWGGSATPCGSGIRGGNPWRRRP